MWRLRSHYFLKCSRSIFLRPESTRDPARYPLGFVPLDGTEPIDAVYSLLKSGHFVAPLNTIEAIHNVYIGARNLCHSEHPLVTAQDLVSGYAKEEVLSYVLIRRDFWNLEDFNDAELNQSFGVQNLYFDNYKWSQMLWKRFQLFVEEYFPVTDHSHLRYSEYMALVKSFFVFEEGASAYPVLPKFIRLHPPFGIAMPSKLALEPISLLKHWLVSFRAVLRLNKALVVNAGAGVTAFGIRLCKVPMVRGTDPRPRAITNCQKDAAASWLLSGVSFQTAELFPSPGKGGARMVYDLIVCYPDEEIIAAFDSESSLYAPGNSGALGKLEEFFEGVSDHLSDDGVIAICTTNLRSILRPTEPHPVEYEIRQNRRFVLLDYFDAPVRHKGAVGQQFLEPQIRQNVELRKKMRAELWILHKLSSIHNFAFFHGIPGAKPPRQSRCWGQQRLLMQRQKQMKGYVELMGGDWGDYKNRLVHMLRESTDEPEDDVAEAVRMALDPTYPMVLSQRAQKAIEQSLKEKDDFHQEVRNVYVGKSPRECFDSIAFSNKT